MRRVALFLGLLTLAHPCIALLATDSSRALQEQFRSGIDLTQFDVVVLDRDRRPVEGLTAEDFTILEDGQPRPIDAFAAITLPPRESDSGSRAGHHIGAEDVLDNQLADEGRLVVIVMDRTIMAGPQTVAARQIALAAIDALGPGDLAAVVRNNGFSNDGLSQGFTADRTRLRAAAESPFTGFREPPLMTSTGLKEVPPDLAHHPSCMCGICVLDGITAAADAMRAASRRQKVLLFIGSDILIQDLDDPGTPSDCTGPLTVAREKMFRALDRANVIVHSIDSSGLETLAKGFGTVREATTPTSAMERNLRRQGNLSVLPDYTGGRVVVNTNAPQSFVQSIFDESQSYYLLGLQRREGGDPNPNKRHEITIKVNRADVIVRNRRGYYPPAPEENESRPADPLDASIASALPNEGMPLRLALTPGFEEDGTPKVDVLLGVQALGPPENSAESVRVDILTGVFDMRARPVGRERRSIEIPAALLPEGAAGFESRSTLDLAPGSYEVRVGVVRADAAQSGSVYGYVDVPAAKAAGLDLSGVVIQAMPALPDVFGRRESEGPLTPTLRRTFSREDELTTAVQVRIGPDVRPPITVRATIIDDGDRTMTTMTKDLADGAFSEARLAEARFSVPIADLSAGRYLLRVEAAAGTAAERRDVAFEIR